jgi:glucoamylase
MRIFSDIIFISREMFCAFVCLLAFAASTLGQACNSSAARVDCGYSGINETQCESKSCCWSPVNPNPDNLPWCFYVNGAPTPSPPPTPLACDDSGLRLDCGYVGIDETGCETKGCCWDPVDPNPNNLPWCFYSNIYTPTPTPPPPPPGTPPFSDAEVAQMMGYFLDNIDIQGSGAVVAAPDYTTPGGSYYYHWMRDAALSMRALMITNNDTDLVNQKMQSYVQWVLKVQNQADPNNIDIRTEPKFTIPDGVPYTGGWCRPQTDGPGLRGGTLALYGLYLLNISNEDYVEKYLWTGDQSDYNGGAVKYDLDWVAQNWQSNGCDLWEEVQSTDFFWFFF